MAISTPSLSSVKPATKSKLDHAKVKSFEDLLSSALLSQTTQSNVCWVMENVGYIDEVLSGIECQQLCHLVKSCNELSFWSDVNQSSPDFVAAKSFRFADTIEINSSNISDLIWSRIETLFTGYDAYC